MVFFSSLKNMKMHRKLLLSYIIMIIIPILIIGTFFITNTKNTVLNYINQINEITLKQVKTNILNSFDGYLKVSDNILPESRLIEMLTKEYKSESDYLNSYVDEILVPLRRLLLTLPHEAKISFFATNETIVADNNVVYYVDEEIKKEDWYREAINAKGANVISLPYINRNGQEVFTISRLLYSTLYSKRNVVMRIEVPLEKIHDLMKEEGKNKNIYLLDDKNRIFTQSVSKDEIGKYSVGQVFEPINSKNRNGKCVLENKEFIVLEELISNRKIFDGWRLVFAISPRIIMEDINRVLYFSLAICAIIVAITILFIFLFSYKLTGRLRKLAGSMTDIKEDESLEVFVDCDGEDEIGELSRSFKEMMDRINTLISEVYLGEIKVRDLELEKKKAELNALQSQVNPHFLFNTMETISMNALTKGDFETCEIVRSFSKLLRRSIEWGDDNTTIKQELDLVEDYLKIQQFRHPGRYTCQIDISPELYNVTIPKFTLQPIIENSIYHGLELKEGGGMLRIFTQKIGEDIEIVVQDNGIGIDEKRLKKIQNSIEDGKSYLDDTEKKRRGLGLINIHFRLKLYYGHDYGLNIHSEEGRYTRVAIRIPIIIEEGNSNV